LLGGKSDSRKIGALGHAKAGLGKIFSNNMTLKAGYGALFVGLEDTEGILQNANQFVTTTWLGLGYSF